MLLFVLLVMLVSHFLDTISLSSFAIQDKFGVRSLRHSNEEMMAALYLQVSIISQALIFVTRSRSWSFIERPGLLLLTAFVLAQLVRINLRRGICLSFLVLVETFLLKHYISA